jgi:hypothetical protein
MGDAACCSVKHLGKPCAGKPHARFDVEGAGGSLSFTLLQHSQRKHWTQYDDYETRAQEKAQARLTDF